MRKIIFIVILLFITNLNAQIAYKCVDTKDKNIWQYFNIDYESIHFKIGKAIIVLHHKNTKRIGNKKIYTFSNGRITFHATKNNNNLQYLYISDGSYNYNCNLHSDIKRLEWSNSIIIDK